MSFPQKGPCPFEGTHWPPVWPANRSVAKSSFSSNQMQDLIKYFYDRESARQTEGGRPKFRFPLHLLDEYFGKRSENIRKAVINSDEYKAYLEERSRPPPPPEMSLLTRDLIAACLLLHPPPPSAAADDDGAWIRERDQWERAHASEAQLVRKLNRHGKGILFSEGMPFGVDGEKRYICGEGKQKHISMGPEWDRSRVMVCNMQKEIEAAANAMWESSMSTKRDIFEELIEKERQKDRSKGHLDTSARAPYKARAALGLVLLLTSVLGYHLLMMISVSVICAYLAFLFDSLSPIFEEHADKKIRNGSELRLQLEGNYWRHALDLWLADTKELEAFLAREGTGQESAEPESGAGVEKTKAVRSNARRTGNKARKVEPLPEKTYPIKAKLEMGLDILIQLATAIHKHALNTPPLKQEPECEDFVDPFSLHNVSLLVSVLRKLELYPGGKDKGLGGKAVRFPAEQRARLPPDGSAPRARVRIMGSLFLLTMTTSLRRCTGDSTTCCARARARARGPRDCFGGHKGM